MKRSNRWFRRIRGTTRRSRGHEQDRRGFSPRLEALEDRIVLSNFGPPTLYPIGSTPFSVAVGDFDGDGTPDLAVANAGSGSVSVLLGKGDGTFRTAVNYAVGADPVSVAVGDFDGDGTPDIAVANLNSNNVSMLLGKGDGIFRPAVNYAVGSGPVSVVAGDFNGDGRLDLAVANERDNTISVLSGDGHGGFGFTNSFSITFEPGALAVGDFNGDGKPDLAVTNIGSNSVSVLLDNGPVGLFGAVTFAPSNYAVGPEPVSVAVGDFNGDGILDLAVANEGNNSVSVLLGYGDGSFHSAGSSYGVGNAPSSVAVGDFDGDGTPDLVTANAGDNTSSVLPGDGHGSFGAATSFAAGTEPVSVAVGDFNGDGFPDLAVANESGAGVSVLLNQWRVTTTTVASSQNPSVYGQPITLTATVTNAGPQAYTPTGLVTFEDGPTVLGTGTLDATGHASLTTFSLGTGDHAITAVYQGDPHFGGSTSRALNQVVDQDASSTALGVSANPAAGVPLTLTATVSPAGASFGTATGTVLFWDGTKPLGTGTSSGGVATLTTAALTPGSHALSAQYVGDSNFTGSTSAALALVINNPAPVVTGIGPATLPEGSPAFTLTITGSNFQSGATVQWNGMPLVVTSLSATQIQAAVPAALVAEEGTALVTVTNPGPGGGPSLPQTFTITDAPLSARGVNLNVISNKNFSGAVATFTDGNPNATAADFTAIITWDNGNASYGTISGSGTFTVSATHSFGGFSNLHTVSVTILDRGGSSVTVTDNVIDPPAATDPGPPPAPPAPAEQPPPVEVNAFAGVAAPQHHGRHHQQARGHHARPAHPHRHPAHKS
jgi:hypothetical protein